MYVLGIVGGIASGKSAVAALFAAQGGVVIDADRLGHEVLGDPDVIAAIEKRWGPSVIGPDGQVLRRAVAQRVFGDDPSAADERTFLDDLVHPRIRQRMESRIKQLQSHQASVFVVIDAALLFETGWDLVCDAVVFVDTPRELRLARAKQRGWTKEQFAARESSQWTVDAKRSRADWVIDNTDSLEQLAVQVAEITQQIREAELA